MWVRTGVRSILSLMNEDARTLADMDALKADIRSETDEGRRRERIREFMMVASEGIAASEDQALAIIEQELEDDMALGFDEGGRYRGQYPSLLRLFDGNTRKAAVQGRDHMIQLARLGHDWSVKRSIMHLEVFCDDVIRGNFRRV